MNADVAARRIVVLKRWRSSIEDVAEPVPSESDLERVGDAGTLWPPNIDRSTLVPWEATIRHLLEQVAIGAADPVRSIPLHLRRPRPVSTPPGPRSTGAPAPGPRPPRHAVSEQAPATPPPAGRQPDPGTPASGTSDSDVLARALRWRERAVAEGVPGAGDLKPGRVRSLVSRGLRSAEEIATGLPSTLAHLAPDLAAAMEGGTGSRTASPGHDGARLADSPQPKPQPGPRQRDGTGSGPDDRPGTASGTAAAPDPVPSPDPDAGPAVDERLKGLTFARFRYQEVPPPAGEVLVEENDVTGGVVLSWPDAVTDGSGGRPPVVIYRVVSDDHAEPYSPNDADSELIAVTCSPTATDDRPFERAVRHFAVWRHAGATEAEAAAAQPVPHAVGYHVVPPRDVEVHYDHPRVVGEWHALDGTAHIQVTRTLRRLGRAAPHEQHWEGYEQFDEGFKDTRPVPGEDYLYWVSAGVEIADAAVMSRRIPCRVQVPALHEPVRDLSIRQHDFVDEHGRHQAFDLSWTQPPHGRVHIYRTDEPPADGLVGHEMGMSALPGDEARLPLEARLRDSPRYSGRRATLENVPWPAGTHRAYFTPVTELNGMAQVGETRSESRLGEIGEPRIVERMREQVITFGWPAGATSVWLYRRAGTGATPMLGERDAEISLDGYERLGGIRVQLDERGERVCLVPVLYEENARPKRGEPVSVDYPGLVTLRYTVGMKRRTDGRVAVAVQVFGSRDDVPPPAFALVHNPYRLPLWYEDGPDTAKLVLTPVGSVGQGASWLIQPTALHPERSQAWETTVDPTGFVRLCVVGRRDVRFALEDPPVFHLRPGAVGEAPTQPMDRPGPASRRWWSWR